MGIPLPMSGAVLLLRYVGLLLRQWRVFMGVQLHLHGSRPFRRPDSSADCLAHRPQLALKHRTTSTLIATRSVGCTCLMRRSSIPGRDSSALASWLSMAARLASSGSDVSASAGASSTPSASTAAGECHAVSAVRASACMHARFVCCPGSPKLPRRFPHGKQGRPAWKRLLVYCCKVTAWVRNCPPSPLLDCMLSASGPGW